MSRQAMAYARPDAKGLARRLGERGASSRLSPARARSARRRSSSRSSKARSVEGESVVPLVESRRAELAALCRQFGVRRLESVRIGGHRGLRARPERPGLPYRVRRGRAGAGSRRVLRAQGRRWRSCSSAPWICGARGPSRNPDRPGRDGAESPARRRRVIHVHISERRARRPGRSRPSREAGRSRSSRPTSCSTRPSSVSSRSSARRCPRLAEEPRHDGGGDPRSCADRRPAEPPHPWLRHRGSRDPLARDPREPTRDCARPWIRLIE